MRYAYLIFISLLLAACFGSYPTDENSDIAAVNPDPNHTHADFAVYIDGGKLSFSDPKYMSSPPQDAYRSLINAPLIAALRIPVASAHEGEEEDGHVIPGREYLHLHDGNGSVIHRHKPGLTLGDFFTSIGFKMTQKCFILDTGKSYCNSDQKQWRMFVNRKEQAFNVPYVFQDLDKILLTYGATEEQVAQQLSTISDDACLYSKTCPERGDPPAENCIADPSVPCVAPLEDL